MPTLPRQLHLCTEPAASAAHEDFDVLRTVDVAGAVRDHHACGRAHEQQLKIAQAWGMEA
eukprot:6194689-Pleurochrysis_carterae.AAC.1